jgi:nicotinate phosphoribosyltransferase
VQTGDGWAAHVAGAIGVSTDAPGLVVGRPRRRDRAARLIAAYGGDTVAAARRFADRFAGEMNITVLVDFENALRGDRARGRRGARRSPVGVRLDTSRVLVDYSALDEMGDFKPTA